MNNSDLLELMGLESRVSMAGPAILPAHSLQAAEAMAQRAFDKWCELKRPGKAGPGFGKADPSDLLIGPYPCNVDQYSTPAERNNAAGTEAITQFAIALPSYVSPRTDDRIAVPGFYNKWVGLGNHAVGGRVTPVNLVKGSGPVLEAVQAGQSGAVEPAWVDLPDALTQDGTVIWRRIGTVSIYEVIGDDEGQSNEVRRVVRVIQLTR